MTATKIHLTVTEGKKVTTLQVTEEIQHLDDLWSEALSAEAEGEEPEYEWCDLETERDQKIMSLLHEKLGGTWTGGLEGETPSTYKDENGRTAKIRW